MDDRLLRSELAILEKMEASIGPGFDALEAYAEIQFQAAKDALYDEIDSDPTVRMAKCEFHRGQAETWRWISEMRTIVRGDIARVRQALAPE